MLKLCVSISFMVITNHVKAPFFITHSNFNATLATFLQVRAKTRKVFADLIDIPYSCQVTIYSSSKRPSEVRDLLQPFNVGTQETTSACIRRLNLRIYIFLFSAGACSPSRGCCFSSFTVSLWMDPSSTLGWIRP